MCCRAGAAVPKIRPVLLYVKEYTGYKQRKRDVYGTSFWVYLAGYCACTFGVMGLRGRDDIGFRSRLD